MGMRGAHRAIVVALVANAVYLVVEVAGGLAFNSLALLADAAHMLTDVLALTVALVALRLTWRPATRRHSFGFVRAEVIAAQVNGLVLVVAALWIGAEAFRRIGEGVEVVGGGLLAVAAIGLAVNLGAAAVLHRAGGGDLNLRAATFHLLADAAGSVGAIAAGVAVTVWDAHWSDPVISLVIAVLVVWSAWRLLRETTHVLLEGVPPNMDPAEVERAMLAEPEVQGVHHLHLWALTPRRPNLSAHVVVGDDMPLHEAQQLADSLKQRLAQQFGIEHATIQLECHVCDPERAQHT